MIKEDGTMKDGYYLDDGTKVDRDSIPTPSLCGSCLKNQKDESACSLTRMDQMDEIREGETFCCFAYEPADTTIDKETVFKGMKDYLAKK